MWRDCLHLDDADMQGVSHNRREVSLNHDSSGASHKQTTRVVNRFQLRSGGTSLCWRPAHGGDEGGVLDFWLLSWVPNPTDVWWLLSSGSYCTGF